MTLGGLVKHLALVEDDWFSVVLMGNEDAEPWAPVDWDADPDWEWRTAADDTPEELRALFDEAVDAVRPYHPTRPSPTAAWTGRSA